MVLVLLMPSTVASPSGNPVIEPWYTLTRGSLRYRPAARFTMSADRSTPGTRPLGPTRSSSNSKATPPPKPTSAPTSPARSSSASTVGVTMPRLALLSIRAMSSRPIGPLGRPSCLASPDINDCGSFIRTPVVFDGCCVDPRAGPTSRTMCSLGPGPRAEEGEHGEHAPVILVRPGQPELG